MTNTTYKDFIAYPTNAEPRDFTRIHDNDLASLISFVLEAYSDYSHPYFTDRRQFAERVRPVIRKIQEYKTKPMVDPVDRDNAYTLNHGKRS